MLLPALDEQDREDGSAVGLLWAQGCALATSGCRDLQQKDALAQAQNSHSGGPQSMKDFPPYRKGTGLAVPVPTVPRSCLGLVLRGSGALLTPGVSG